MEKKKKKKNEMKYGRATTDAKSNMHHQTNIAIQTNVCTSYSGTEAKIQLVALSFIGKIFSEGNNW